MEEQFDIAKDYVAQEEVGESGTPHVQGVIKYKFQKDFKWVKEKWGRAHIEMCNDWAASAIYCSKADTKKEGGRSWSLATSWAADLYDPMEGKERYHWQKHLLAKIAVAEENEDRTIFWYWENVGNTGKSALARHICITNPRALYVYGKTADIMQVLAMKKEEAEGKMKKMTNLIIYDCPRSGNINYHALEMIKNGTFMAGKYKSQMIVMNPPFIVVFSNHPPADGELSKDRLKVYKIKDHKAVEDDGWAVPFTRTTIVRTDDQAFDWDSIV